MKNFILVIDAYGLIYRTYYAFYNNPLMTNEGKNISCVYGFFNTLQQLLEKFQPDTVIAALDSIGPTFRHEQYPDYKANRDKTPEDLHEQIPIIEDILEAMQVQTLRCNGFEADDIIATITKENNSAENEIYIFSNDKDLLQLVDTSIFIIKSDNKNKLKVCGIEDVETEWGVSSEQILDLLSLTGDSADNIKGVAGIGIKTAQKILTNYKSVSDLIENIDSDKVLTPRLKQKLLDGKENFLQAKSLIKLNDSVPINFDFTKTNFDFVAVAKKLFENKIPSIAKKYEKLSGEKVLDNKTKSTTSEKLNTKKTKPQSKLKKINPSLKKDLTPLQQTAHEGTTFNLNVNTVFVSSNEMLKTIFDKNKNAESITLHIQTFDETSNEISYLCFCFNEQSVYILNFFDTEHFEFTSTTKNIFDETANTLKTFFEKKDLTFLIHDAKPTLKILKQNLLIDSFDLKVFDTSLAAWVLQSTLNNYSIETISKAIFNLQVVEYKEISKRKKNFLEIEKDLREKYLVQNTLITFYFYNLFYPALQENNLKKIYQDIELKLLPILCRMEEAGIFLSVDELNKFSESIASEIKINEDAIYKEAGYEFNVSSPKQLQVVLFDEKKLKPLKKIKTGYSTDDATLESLINDDPIIVPIMNYRKLTKLQSTYADALPKLVDENGFVHTTFLQTGTATGRLSSKDPNLQNIPIREEVGRKIRHAFYATDGELLVSADYSQIELVVLAHLSGDPALCDAFNNKLDVHAKTASVIFGTEVESVTSEMRRVAKIINFGVIYGMSAFRLSNELKIPRKNASAFIESYFQNYSGVTSFLETIKTFAEEHGYVETITGRRRYIPEINNRNKIVKNAAERIAINTPIQGSASDIVKLAMIEMEKIIINEKINAKLLLQVHDEIIFSCAKTDVEKLKAITKTTMENIVNLKVPLRVSIETGKSWGDFH